MNDFPWLTTIGVVPLVGVILIMLIPRSRTVLAKQIALLTSLAVVALVVAMATQYEKNAPGYKFKEKHEWIPAFGVNYALGVDGIALVLIALAVVLVPVVIVAAWHEADPPSELGPLGLGGGAGGAPADASSGQGRATSGSAGVAAVAPARSVKTFFALILVLETMMIGVFAATDVFLFYVFFEAMLIPMYFLIGSYGGPQRSYAAVKFLLYSLFGGLLMLAALIGLYVVAKSHGVATFDVQQLIALAHQGVVDPTTQKWLFLGFFIAFAIKAPLFPFHTWLPDAAAESTPGTAVLLVGVLDKVGTFGMLRLCLPLFPDASRYFTPVVLVL